MFAINSTLVLSAAMMLVDWTSGKTIMYNAQKFMINVMENDQSWAEQLNVSINVDVETVSMAALKVLERLKIVTPELVKELEARSVPKPEANKKAEESTSTSATKVSAKETEETQKTAHVPQVVQGNALHIVADVVSLNADKGDALEFGMAVIASAVKCDVLQNVAVQVHAIIQTLDSQTAQANAARVFAVWDTLVLFLDKLAGLKESVAAESELYQTWMTVVERLVAGTLKADNLESFQKLVDVNRQSTCGNVVLVEQVPEKLGFDINTNHWNTEDGIIAIFVSSQKALEKIFDQLPISTMDRDLWDVYLNKTELTQKIIAIATAMTTEQTEEPTAVEKQDEGSATDTEEEFVLVYTPDTTQLKANLNM